jgi:hypothetical protein
VQRLRAASNDGSDVSESTGALELADEPYQVLEEQNLGDDDGDITSTSIITPALARLGERLPYEPEVLHFAATARKPDGGYNTATMRVEVEDVGPLRVTFPSFAGDVLYNFSSITWDTNGAEAIAEQVDVLLSVDGGHSWPHSLGRVSNNGAIPVAILPSSLCASAGASLLTSYVDGRVMVSSVAREGHRFFAISDFPITVSCSTLSTSLVIVVATSVTGAVLVGILVLLVGFRMVRSRKPVLVAGPVRPNKEAEAREEEEPQQEVRPRLSTHQSSRRWSRFSSHSNMSQASAQSNNNLASPPVGDSWMESNGRQGELEEDEVGMSTSPATQSNDNAVGGGVTARLSSA